MHETTCYLNVHIISDTLNLAILYNDENSEKKFSNVNEFVNWCNQLAIHFAHLVYTEKKNTKNH